MGGLASARVAVIGAGPSGLAAAKKVLQAGCRNLVVYEPADPAGGNWVYTEREGRSSVCETTEPRDVDVGDGNIDLFLRVFHPDHPTLCFIGLVQPAGCIWPLSEAQAALAVRRLAGRYRLPSDVRTRIARQGGTQRRRYLDSPRHTIEVDYHEHLRELEREISRSG